MLRRGLLMGLAATPISLTATHSLAKVSPKIDRKLMAQGLRYLPQFDCYLGSGKPRNTVDFFWSPGCKYSMFTAMNTIGPAWVERGANGDAYFRYKIVPRTDDEVALVAQMIARRSSLAELSFELFFAASRSTSGVLTNEEIASLIERFPRDSSADMKLCKLSACVANRGYGRILNQAQTPSIYVNGKQITFNSAAPSSAVVLSTMVV